MESRPAHYVSSIRFLERKHQLYHGMRVNCTEHTVLGRSSDMNRSRPADGRQIGEQDRLLEQEHPMSTDATTTEDP